MKYRQTKIAAMLSLFLLVACNENSMDTNGYSDKDNASNVAPVAEENVDSGVYDPIFFTLADMVGESDLVIEAKLESIDYQNSIEGIPHTFATYQVREVFKGNYSDNTITLRFIGGYDHADPNIHLHVSNAPELEVGEVSFLMVSKNTINECPLYGCERGRFRTVDSTVVNAAEKPMGVNKADGSLQAVRSSSGDYKVLTPNGFAKQIRKLVSQNNSSSGKNSSVNGKGNASIKSANIYESFSGPKFLAAPAPESSSSKSSSESEGSKVQASDFDRWEEEQVRRNNGNPVIEASYQGSK